MSVEKMFKEISDAVERIITHYTADKAVVMAIDINSSDDSPDRFFEIKGKIFHPKVCPIIPSDYSLETAQGEALDKIAEGFGLKRLKAQEPTSEYYPIETDVKLRDRVKDAKAGSNSFQHYGHEIIENHADGKKFKYCRNCKVEVV